MEDKGLTLRTVSRIQVMKIIYTADFNTISFDTSLRMTMESGILNEDDVNEDKNVLEATKGLLYFVEENLEKIDEIISSTLKNYSLARLNLVDKAIIRVATAELLEKKLDKRIIINEALEITKLYSDQGDHKAVSFNNRLLDNISKTLD